MKKENRLEISENSFNTLEKRIYRLELMMEGILKVFQEELPKIFEEEVKE